MLIRKREIKQLSRDIRKIIDGRAVDLRDNREGAWYILKNDIHTLANLKNEQTEALKRERDAMSDTLANISHQLKTPLTSMMIMADLLENAAGTDVTPPEKQAEFLSNIKTGLFKMEWLTSALLKMARVDAGAAEFRAERVQSGDLIGLALEPLQILLEIKNQSVEISPGVELFCDGRWTAEALTNVIKNASEYSPDGGAIRVESGRNPICAWISVTDSGSGIAKTAGLFERFTGSRGDNGYGVGLPLALAIMRGQNGDIEVDGGGDGSGATFTLKFYTL